MRPTPLQFVGFDKLKAAANAINIFTQSCDDADQRARYNGLEAANARERSDALSDEAQIMASAKISMADAFAAAEKATGGKAVGVGHRGSGRRSSFRSHGPEGQGSADGVGRHADRTGCEERGRG